MSEDQLNAVLVASNLIERNNQILFVEEGKDEIEGLWSLPSGSIRYGEEPREAARREAREEACVDVDIEDLLGIYIDESDTTEGRVIDFVYHSTARNNPEVPFEDTVRDYEWVDYQAIQELDLRNPYVEDIIDEYRSEGESELVNVIDSRTQSSPL